MIKLSYFLHINILFLTYTLRLTRFACHCISKQMKQKYLIRFRPLRITLTIVSYTIPYYFFCLLHLFIFSYSNRMVSKCSCYLIKQMSSSSHSLLSPLTSISPMVGIDEFISLLNFASGSKV
jgi:hypothetical protein